MCARWLRKGRRGTLTAVDETTSWFCRGSKGHSCKVERGLDERAKGRVMMGREGCDWMGMDWQPCSIDVCVTKKYGPSLMFPNRYLLRRTFASLSVATSTGRV